VPDNVGRVVVGVNGSISSLAALRRAVAEASRGGGALLAVLTWTPVGGEINYRRAPCPPLLRLWEQQARERMRTCFDEVFGGVPTGVRVDTLVVRAERPGQVLVALADRSDDLLVVGAGARGWLVRLRHGAVSRYCLAHADCAVLAVPPPGMLRELKRRHRRWRPRDVTNTLGLDGSRGRG